MRRASKSKDRTIALKIKRENQSAKRKLNISSGKPCSYQYGFATIVDYSRTLYEAQDTQQKTEREIISRYQYKIARQNFVARENHNNACQTNCEI
jgi:hypothetical protein